MENKVKSTVTRTDTYTKDQLIALLREKVFGKDANVSFKIQEVGRDPMDRFPGYPDVVSIEVTSEVAVDQVLNKVE